MTIAKFGKTPINLETLGVTLQRLWNNIPPKNGYIGVSMCKRNTRKIYGKEKIIHVFEYVYKYVTNKRIPSFPLLIHTKTRI